MLPNRMNYYKYQPVSAPEPLDAYKAAIEDATQTYDKNLETAGLLQASLSKFKALPKDREYLDKVVEKVQNTFSTLAGTIQGNKRWDLASDTINELKMNFLKDQKLQGIQESYKGYQEELELEQKILASGKTPVNLNLVDWQNHQTFSPDGSLNIYRSKLQPKADYNSEMFELAKVIQPDTIDSELQAAGIDGFLKSTKKRELTDKKINENLPEMFRSYQNTDTYKQQKTLKIKEFLASGMTMEQASQQADLSIAQSLKDIASLRVYSEEDKSFIQDPNYAREQNLENELIKIKARQQAKHSGQPIDDGKLFRPSTEKTKDKVHYDKNVTFGNPNIVKNVQTIVGVPTPDEVFALDGIDLGDKKIKSFTPLGMTTVNRSGNADWDGAWSGNLVITDSNGKNEQTINAYVKNKDTSIRSNFGTVNNIARALDTDTGSTAMKVPDSSGLITMKLRGEYVPISASNIELEVIKYGKGSYKVKPVQKGEDGKYKTLPKSLLDKYELKESYSLDELETRSLNNLNPYISTLSLSDKQLSE